jgi:molecular chaperone GrpE
MTYPGNGQTVRIPVQRVRPQLPAVEEDWRLLLAKPKDGQESAVDAAAGIEGEATDWEAQASRLQTEVKDLNAKASYLQAEVEHWKAQASDLQAEMEDCKSDVSRLQTQARDIRRRAEHQTRFRVQEERARLLNRLLTVADNLERALLHADADDARFEGVRLTLDDLLGQLAKDGVERIQALGKPFDPNTHEAVATDGSGGQTVVGVQRNGYTLDGVLLRPAQVIVGKMKVSS